MPLPEDPLDLAILRCLQEDVRMSIAEIASRLETPESTTRSRLNRLKESGLVQLSALANPLALGFQTWNLFHIECELSQVREVAASLAAESDIHFVTIVAGDYELLAAGVFKTNAEFLGFLTTRLAGMKGIRRIKTANI